MEVGGGGAMKRIPRTDLDACLSRVFPCDMFSSYLILNYIHGCQMKRSRYERRHQWNWMQCRHYKFRNISDDKIRASVPSPSHRDWMENKIRNGLEAWKELSVTVDKNAQRAISNTSFVSSHMYSENSETLTRLELATCSDPIARRFH